MIPTERLTPPLMALALLLASCSSTPDTGLSSIEPGGGLMGVSAENPAYWEEWTPRTPAMLSVDEVLDPPTVFDAWRIEDGDFQQMVWDPLFHALNALAIDSGGDVEPMLRSLMIRLEPGVEPTRWELSFVSQQQGRAEGIVLRIVCSDGAGLWLEAKRSADGPPEPTQWILRAEPAAEEVPGLTAWFTQSGDRWEVHTTEGADAEAPTSPASTEDNWSDLVGLWKANLWEAVTGRYYLEPEFIFSDSDDDLAVGWPPSLGKPLEQRGIDEFIAETVFTPRLGDEGLEHF